jgi:uncharacterized protein YcfL
MKTMALIAVSRMALAGCSAGNAANCARRSGEVLNKTQSTAFELTAIEDWVRGVALMLPVRTP